ncbi:histidine phosphatase family protein, partial [Streptomyces sp. HCCB10043]
MTATAARYLYVTRHGEASEDETTLTEAGRRQAALLGERLRGAPITAIHHGPLPRAEQTARLVGERLPGVPLLRSEPAGDYLPYLPSREELPAESADRMLARLAEFPAAERELGPG